jgi:exopolysaccharide biosynthesis protein
MRLNAARALFAVAACASLPAWALDRVTFPYPCVEHLHRVVPGLDAHVVVADLACGQVEVTATRPRDRASTVATFAHEYGAQIAVNANFYEGSTCGLALGERVLWRDAYDRGCVGSVAFGPSPTGTLARVFDSTGRVREVPFPWAWNAVTGRPMLLREGHVWFDEDEPNGMYRTHPRTAVGLTPGGASLVLVVIDGRRAGLPGVTSLQLLPLLEEFGVTDAVNLDGGGSSELWIASEGGVVNRPSDRHERRVVNHLGLRITSALGRPQPPVP